MTLSPQGRPLFETTVSAQALPTITMPPSGAGLEVTADDLRFIFHQIRNCPGARRHENGVEPLRNAARQRTEPR